MGRVAKGVKCSVSGCGKEAVRSLSSARIKSADLKIESGRRGYLCKEHYKEYKKKTRKEKQVEQWRFSRTQK